MDIQIIALWGGLAITFILGLINFLWGGGVLSRKDKVNIMKPMPIIDTTMMVNRKGVKPHLLIQTRFTLVRTKGEQDLYFESAYLRLNEAIIKKLEQYFVLPGHEIYGNITYYGREPDYKGRELTYKERVSLKINESVELKISETFFIQDSLLKILEEEERDRKVTQPDIYDNLDRLKRKFKIVWIDSKGKEWQYRFPKNWWNKLFPEWLWWKIR